MTILRGICAAALIALAGCSQQQLLGSENSYVGTERTVTSISALHAVHRDFGCRERRGTFQHGASICPGH